MQPRPIRELVNSKELRASGKGAVMRERRGKDRFACRIPGVLAVQDKELPIECQEISEVGARVHSLRPAALKTGLPVLLRIRIGTQVFEDAFRIVQVKSGPGGIAVHLRVNPPEPASAP